MADRVLLHIGLPKTATSYLQGIVWSHRDQLRNDGVLLPGTRRRDHLWFTWGVLEEQGYQTAAKPWQRTALDRVLADIAAWPGTALVTHEFLASATAEQAQDLVAVLAPAEVHVVVTAREPLGLFTASWQESLKNRGVAVMAEYPPPVDDPQPIWDWWTLDLVNVLERWGSAVPPAQLHVLPLPPSGAPRDLVWRRFAALLGVDPAGYDADAGFANRSMGVVEAETLRRINLRFEEHQLMQPRLARGTMIRSYLADDRLVPRKGERFWPHPEQIADCRTRGERAVAAVQQGGYDVIGDIEDLQVPDELAARRTADEVSDAEVAAVATDVLALAVEDLRQLREERNELRRQLRNAEARLAEPPPPPPPTLALRVRRRSSVWLRRAAHRADTPPTPR